MQSSYTAGGQSVDQLLTPLALPCPYPTFLPLPCVVARALQVAILSDATLELCVEVSVALKGYVASRKPCNEWIAGM
jgi:hypothetical protein